MMRAGLKAPGANFITLYHFLCLLRLHRGFLYTYIVTLLSQARGVGEAHVGRSVDKSVHSAGCDKHKILQKNIFF